MATRPAAWGTSRTGAAEAPRALCPRRGSSPGQRLDGGTGLYYYGARYYDAGLGRFISPDTIVPNLTNPQAWNRYSYVINNPLRYVDLDGHCYGPARGLRDTFLGIFCSIPDVVFGAPLLVLAEKATQVAEASAERVVEPLPGYPDVRKVVELDEESVAGKILRDLTGGQSAITLNRVVVTTNDVDNPEGENGFTPVLAAHEGQHAKDQHANPLFFLVDYLFEQLIHGYEQNYWEKGARAAQEPVEELEKILEQSAIPFDWGYGY